jgi:F-type H+-transporting ATPase subunit delta
VASNTRSSGTAAFRYASALVELAIESGAIPQIEKDVADLRAMIGQSKDLKAMISSPLVNVKTQQDVLAEIAERAKLSNLTANFLMVLAANRRLPDIDQILKAVQENLSGRRGEMRAKVQSAVELSSAQTKTLEESLSKTLGQPVAIDATVNTSLIGGVTITLGSLLIDDSVKTKLERLARAMKSDGAKAA